MDTPLPIPRPAVRPARGGALARRIGEFRLIAQDPVLLVGLLAVGAFLFAFIIWPLGRVIYQGFFTPDGAFNLQWFSKYVDPKYVGQYWRIFLWTVEMGVLAATGSTILGFLFAYTVVRCDIPFKGLVHALTLLPTISPPFAIALAAILLFGRAGLVTSGLLHIQFGPGMNDIYGMDGLVFVQIITFFSIAYLILRGMLERIDPSMEEAALALGASKWHIFRTITLPLLTPGIAASFLLMFVESLADLGNPLFIAGNVTVLSTQIWMAIMGEFDQQKGAALSLVLLLPTLTVFLLQRYWVSRRSYISVTGKPTGGRVFVKEPVIRWTFITLTALVLLLVVALYAAIFAGSITKLWGIDYSLDLTHFGEVGNRGLKAILDTTFLSAVATPIAGLAGMVIAYLVVRKAFSGKESLDFASTLGGAVPGTILGIGFIIAFIKAPIPVVAFVYFALGLYLVSAVTADWGRRVLLFALGTLLGMVLLWLTFDLAGRQGVPLVGGLATLPFQTFDLTAILVFLAVLFALMAAGTFRFVPRNQWRGVLVLLVVMAIYMISRQFISLLTDPLVVWGRGLGGPLWPTVFTSLGAWINLFFQPPLALLGFTYLVLAGLVVRRWQPGARSVAAVVLIGICCALTFYGEPLALVGSPYIVLAAYAVRSLPASVRAGSASLLQIDPAIEEASTSLGADASTTFRRITLPLILPAFVAGLIFSFARHMTSLSAIIFLSTPKWPILTSLIMSEVEQGGLGIAAAYSVVLIVIVLAAIGLLYLWAGRAFRTTDVELTLGAG